MLQAAILVGAGLVRMVDKAVNPEEYREQQRRKDEEFKKLTHEQQYATTMLRITGN